MASAMPRSDSRGAEGLGGQASNVSLRHAHPGLDAGPVQGAVRTFVEEIAGREHPYRSYQTEDIYPIGFRDTKREHHCVEHHESVLRHLPAVIQAIYRQNRPTSTTRATHTGP